MEKFVWEPKDGITIPSEINWVRTSELNWAQFEEYNPTTQRQEELKEAILEARGAEIGDFEVYIQPRDGKARNDYEIEEWARAYNQKRNSKLGTRTHYYLYLAWQIQEGKKTWKQVCDEKDMAEAFRILKEERTFFFAGGCDYIYRADPESDVVCDSHPDNEHNNYVAFVVLS